MTPDDLTALARSVDDWHRDMAPGAVLELRLGAERLVMGRHEVPALALLFRNHTVDPDADRDARLRAAAFARLLAQTPKHGGNGARKHGGNNPSLVFGIQDAEQVGTTMSDTPETLMRTALDQAREALEAGDHPYGAVLVTAAGTMVERNRVVTTTDPTAHSEVMAIRSAAKAWGLASTAGSLLVTSYEPCPMCLGAILEAGVAALTIGVRRTVGEPPLGDYTVERLLALLGRGADIAVSCGVPGDEAAQFYAVAG
jgi:tRNA(Arg) A34 adenosine deaminase TadA